MLENLIRAHYLQHVSFESLGCIEPWLQSSGYQVTNTRLFESATFPELDKIDLLIVVGGPMSVNDEGEFPWLVQEKRYISDVIQAGKTVLGICLGAQLIASAMGAHVYRNPEKEIGWFPVQGIPSMDGSSFHIPSSVTVFHWHGEAFDLPYGAVHLARSEGCENQAFQLGKTVIGLQFHLEATPESVREIVSNCRTELLPSKFVQSETDILSAKSERYRVINNLMVELLILLNSGRSN
jgi:GMP synthase-like glutamine amidotransferase